MSLQKAKHSIGLGYNVRKANTNLVESVDITSIFDGMKTFRVVGKHGNIREGNAIRKVVSR